MANQGAQAGNQNAAGPHKKGGLAAKAGAVVGKYKGDKAVGFVETVLKDTKQPNALPNFKAKGLGQNIGALKAKVEIKKQPFKQAQQASMVDTVQKHLDKNRTGTTDQSAKKK
jgi:hypothetical protein